MNKGPYKNQMLYGDVTHGGLKRVFAEKIQRKYQGAAFRFSQGLEAGINRLVWGSDGALYVGGIGSSGNWGHHGKLTYGLQRLEYNDRKKVRLQLPGMKPEHVIYIRLNRKTMISERNKELWSTEAWYTMNNIPD